MLQEVLSQRYSSPRGGGLRLSRLLKCLLSLHALLQYPIPCSVPDSPLTPAPYPEFPAYVLSQDPLAASAPPIEWVGGWASYLRIEADLTDITGNDGPLSLEQGSPKSVGKHSLLYRVHLWRQAGVSQEPQHKLMSIIPPVAGAGLNRNRQGLFLILQYPGGSEPPS